MCPNLWCDTKHGIAIRLLTLNKAFYINRIPTCIKLNKREHHLYMKYNLEKYIESSNFEMKKFNLIQSHEWVSVSIFIIHHVNKQSIIYRRFHSFTFLFFVIVFTDVYILASAYPELGLGHVTRRGPGDNGDYDECSCTEIRLHSCEEGFIYTKYWRPGS